MPSNDVDTLNRLVRAAMDKPERTEEERREKARALSAVLVPVLELQKANSTGDDLTSYPPYVDGGHGAGRLAGAAWEEVEEEEDEEARPPAAPVARVRLPGPEEWDLEADDALDDDAGALDDAGAGGAADDDDEAWLRLPPEEWDDRPGAAAGGADDDAGAPDDAFTRFASRLPMLRLPYIPGGNVYDLEFGDNVHLGS
eukprot:jgi/Mesvir1/20121/Mv13360-RA.1